MIRLFFFLLCFLIFSCSRQQSEFEHYISVDEAIQFFHRNPFLLSEQLVFVENGDVLSDKDLAGIHISDYGHDYMIDSNNEVTTIFLRDKRYQDNILRIIVSNYGNFPLYEIYPFYYDCDSLVPVLELVRDSDNQISNPRINYDRNLDSVENAMTFSILSYCTHEKLLQYSRKDLIGLFLSVQHSSKETISFYYPYFVEAVKEGVFKQSYLALLTDRLLIYYNYPQVYGSQLSENYIAENIMHESKVDSLRAEMGMEPLSTYVRLFNRRDD